jgi:membrane protein involved in colicin uptake
VTVQQIQAFKREQELEADGADPSNDEVDLRAEDDAAIAAELEAEAERRAAEEAQAAEDAARKAAEAEAAGDATGADEDDGKPRRSRSRTRGGRSRIRSPRAAGSALEGTFDHGEEGYGLWLDPDVQDDPVYAEHWAGHRPVEVTIEEDQIVIRRTGGDEDSSDD